MTIITPSVIWEATDEELRQLIKQAQNELSRRHMDNPDTETSTPFAELKQEFGLGPVPCGPPLCGT